MHRMIRLPGLAVLMLYCSIPPCLYGASRLIDIQRGLNLSFEANQGQAPADTRFVARSRGSILQFTSSELRIIMPGPNHRKASPLLAWAGRAADLLSLTKKESNPVLVMKIPGNTAPASITGHGKQPGRIHYLRGNDPGQWRTNIPVYSMLKYESVLPGVNLLFYGTGGNLEFDLVLEPGADPSAIQLEFLGADNIAFDNRGDLVLSAESGLVRLNKPHIYQEKNNVRKPVEGGFELLAGNGVGFNIREYDRSQDLVIDPVLEYSSYLGGNNAEYAGGIAMDDSGNLYLTGSTFSPNFPDPSINSQIDYHWDWDGFVTKLGVSPEGDVTVIYSTYIGGSKVDDANTIAIDHEGGVYIAGTTNSSNFPATPGAYQGYLSSGSYDAFLSKLNSDGSGFVYSTYFGGSSAEYGLGVAVDESLNTYLAGYTETYYLPVTPDSFGSFYKGGGDGFLVKFKSDGTDFIYSNYIGGSGYDRINDVKVDSKGAAFVAGLTYSDNLPTTANVFQPKRNGHDDSWVAKVAPSGTALDYITYIGGNCEEEAFAIDLDEEGNVYYTGYAETFNFPATPGAFQTSHHRGLWDAIVAKLNPDGTDLVYATYLGGENEDMGFDIDVDASGNAWVTGYTKSATFPTTTGAIQRNIKGREEAFISVFDATGSHLPYSTLFGGADDDNGESVVIDASGLAWILGWTQSDDVPTTPGAFRTTYGGGNSDLFLIRIAPSELATISAASYAVGEPVAAGSIASGFGSDLANMPQGAASLPLPEKLADVELTVTDSIDSSHVAPLFYAGPGQINYLIPPETAAGAADVAVTRNGLLVARGTLNINAVSPGIFTANADGAGAPAAYVEFYLQDGSYSSQFVFQCPEGAGSCVPLPVNVEPAQGQVFLTLFGTGFRGRSSLDAVTATIGGASAEVLYAGPQGDYAGLDQINIRLDPSLAGSGSQPLVMSVDGVQSNEILLAFE